MCVCDKYFIFLKIKLNIKYNNMIKNFNKIIKRNYSISRIDKIAKNITYFGKTLDNNHPGFHDKDYKYRRHLIAESAILK